MAEEHLRLKSLRIRGYKVLRDFVLDDIGPLNVVVGPNGCGKTALFEIITLIRELASGSEEGGNFNTWMYSAFSKLSQEGFYGVLSRPMDKNPTIEIHVELTPSYKYNLILALQGQLPVVKWEELRVGEESVLKLTGETPVFWFTTSIRREPPTTEPRQYHLRTPGSSDEKHIVDIFVHPLLLRNANLDQLAQLMKEAPQLRSWFRNWQGFKPYWIYSLGRDPSELSPQIRGNQLEEEMHNLPQVLLRLKLDDLEKFFEIREIFQAAVGVEWVLDATMTNPPHPSLVTVYLKGDKDWFYQLANWPDGWKAFLSWLVALRTAPPGAVIYLEEPENNLHPRLIAQILEQVEIANERGVQVFISTHSMELVNMIEPNELILMQDGQAYRLDPEKADKIREAGILLGSAWTSGFLEAAKKE